MTTQQIREFALELAHLWCRHNNPMGREWDHRMVLSHLEKRALEVVGNEQGGLYARLVAEIAHYIYMISGCHPDHGSIAAMAEFLDNIYKPAAH